MHLLIPEPAKYDLLLLANEEEVVGTSTGPTRWNRRLLERQRREGSMESETCRREKAGASFRSSCSVSGR
jgi:hypothetical protein